MIDGNIELMAPTTDSFSNVLQFKAPSPRLTKSRSRRSRSNRLTAIVEKKKRKKESCRKRARFLFFFFFLPQARSKRVRGEPKSERERERAPGCISHFFPFTPSFSSILLSRRFLLDSENGVLRRQGPFRA